MEDEDKNWLKFPRYSAQYIQGVKSFINNAFANYAIGDDVRCPCKKCSNREWHCRASIYDHLICNGFSPTCAQWILDVSCLVSPHNGDEMAVESNGEFGDDLHTMLRTIHRDVPGLEDTNEGVKKGPDANARKFYRLIDEGKTPLYPGCKAFSTLSFIVSFYLIKCSHGISESGFTAMLKLLKLAFPFANLPKSFNEAKNMIKDLGLDYQKIDSCPNDCMLYWGINKNEVACKICGLSRWKEVETKGVSGQPSGGGERPKVAAKTMRYFPLKPRLQRMFMSKEYSKLMRWHSMERKMDGKLRHPADGEAWKTMDENYPQFSSEIRNVRLGLASDGFNPFRTLSTSHSTWPIILVNYNLPPWLITKAENVILSTLIPGPTSPGNNIDVYMEPLITELKDLWDSGLETYDALADETFKLHASVLWTISDFPGYAMLSGWSTKGKLACPTCNTETDSTYLKFSKKMCYMGHRRFLDASHKYRFDKKRFDGTVETRGSPKFQSGTDVELLLREHVNKFGQQKRKRNSNDESPWRKKSIFFQLPYWQHNLVRHNLDVMHIEKNVFDNIIGTLLDISGKTKDHYKARQDLQYLGIRKHLHPILSSDGVHFEYKAASFTMSNKEKELFCSVLKNAKLPYGCVSNISRCVNMKERKLLGYKSHDAHYIMQNLLQFAVINSLNPEISMPLVRLGAFFRGICNKVIDVGEIKKLQQEIVEILCVFEGIFPPTFFDIMIHLQIHLCREVELGGPVHLRWMYPIEQYLGKLKSYVRNRSKPEGSIAEGYLAEECLTFCSRFLNDDGKISAKSSIFERSKSLINGCPVGRKKKGRIVELDEDSLNTAHRYILFNCDNNEIEELMKEHKSMIDTQLNMTKYEREAKHTKEFQTWLKEEVHKKTNISSDLAALARGLNPFVKSFSGYAINGFRFHTKQKDANCTTQNSGVFYTAFTQSFCSSKDNNPILGDVGYYGAIEEILQFDYWGVYDLILFRCCWYQHEKDCNGMTRVNFNKLYQRSDPFVLAVQVEQVFYIECPLEKGVHYVMKKKATGWCDVLDGEHQADFDNAFDNA